MRTAGLALGLAVMVGACGGASQGGGGAGGADGLTDPGGYAHDIRPIFQGKCTNGACHAVDAPAGGRINPDVPPPLDYADLIRSAPGCPHGDHVYGCLLDAVEQGVMPFRRGCSGDPSRDAGNPSCLTAPELDELRRWVEAGAPP